MRRDENGLVNPLPYLLGTLAFLAAGIIAGSASLIWWLV